MSQKVLIVGSNVRNIAESAKKSGCEVIAITKYADADLKIYCKKTIEIESIDEKKIPKLVEETAESENAKIVLASGFETLDVRGDLLCTEPKKCKVIVDKLKFYKILERAGLPYPELIKESDTPAILKPRIGGGGENVTLALRKRPGYILQRYIDGIPCSVSLIVGEEAFPIACNYIIAGWQEMNASGFRYCGNITPLVETEIRRELIEIAKQTVELFDLRGSVGVDFIYADKPYILEVNPRFQGSLDSIEWSYDLNLFELHKKAFDGKRISTKKPSRFAIRSILFTNRKTKIKSPIVGNPFYADIPSSSRIYEIGEPLISILATGNSIREVKEKVVKRKRLLDNLGLFR